MHTTRRLAATVLIVALALSASCSMRISGTVRDASSGQPIGGAVLSANDGRSRLSTTDPAGGFVVKTDWRPTNLTVSAPGYQTNTVVVPDADRYPIVYVDLERAFHVGGTPTADRSAESAPLVAPIHQGQGTEARLQELQQLHDRGVISDAEYKKMRARIVSDF